MRWNQVMTQANARQPRSTTSSGKTDWAALETMTDEEAEAAARADPDAPPLTGDQPLRPMTRAKRVRFGLRLSRQEFSDRYPIPLEKLTACERRDIEPDAVAVAFLDAIVADPDGVAKALAKSAARAAAAA